MAALRLAQGGPAEALRQAQACSTLTQEAMLGPRRAERELREVLGHGRGGAATVMLHADLAGSAVAQP